MPTRSVDIGPDLRTMLKKSVSFVLAVLPKDLSWSRVHRFLLKIGVDYLSERMFYCIQKPPVPFLSSVKQNKIIILKVSLKKILPLLMEAGAILETLPNQSPDPVITT
jgi:hypothetical protein